MNSQLTAPSHQHPSAPSESVPSEPAQLHPPDPLAQLAPVANRVARTSWLDRAAMRVGLWLVLWGSRPADPQNAVERHRRNVLREQQRAKYEADAAYAVRLWTRGA